MMKDRVISKNDLCVKRLLFKEKNMFKSQFMKSNHRVLRKNKVDTYGTPVLHQIVALLL